jgi:uncharacterized membrane protein
MPEVDVAKSEDNLLVLTATFNTLGGANLAVNKLEEMEKQGLLALDSSLTVSKNAWDKIDIHETTGDTGKKGVGVGAIVGGIVGLIFPPAILATTALGAAVGGMAGVLRGADFDQTDVQAMADQLEKGQSMLIGLVEPQWQDEIQAALDSVATKVGWTTLNKSKLGQLLQAKQSSD